MWTIQNEVDFFQHAIKIASIEKLMVNVNNNYYAFSPKNETVRVNTPQARNSLIGNATEKWCKEFFKDIAAKNGLYAINGVVCEELGLTRQSPADLAFCTTNQIVQSSANIKLVFEIKMGIVNNYIYHPHSDFNFCGDYTTHKGNPSLLRSDSMLKAIGKSINIRVDSPAGRRIPIVIIGNSPITESYTTKVDSLCNSGVIQKFISLYPEPTNHSFIKETDEKGFETFSTPKGVEEYISHILGAEMNYFSSMMNNTDLGRIISIASAEETDELKGQKFIELLNV